MAKLAFLSRLVPPLLRTREVLDDTERLRLLANCEANNPVLRAILDRLQETLEYEFHVVIDPQRSNEERLRACEGLRVSYYNLKQIEDDRLRAGELRGEQSPPSAK